MDYDNIEEFIDNYYLINNQSRHRIRSLAQELLEKIPYDYSAAIEQDIEDYIMANGGLIVYEYTTLEELHEILYDKLCAEDSVTGNGGNFYDTAENCEKYLRYNWNLFLDAVFEFGENSINPDSTFFQQADLTIRCNLLWDCLWNVINKLINN